MKVLQFSISVTGNFRCSGTSNLARVYRVFLLVERREELEINPCRNLHARTRHPKFVVENNCKLVEACNVSDQRSWFIGHREEEERSNRWVELSRDRWKFVRCPIEGGRPGFLNKRAGTRFNAANQFRSPCDEHDDRPRAGTAGAHGLVWLIYMLGMPVN